MEEEALVPVEQRPVLVASKQIFGGLVPRNLDELWRMATWIAKSGMAPPSMETPERISVAIQMGLEVGLMPMMAVQNIAVINKRPAIWGDAALGLVKASGELDRHKEWFEGDPFTDGWTAHCMVRRKGDVDESYQTFSYREAKTAKLVPAHPDSAWAKYPKRMLQMRARSWALRDKFADVLKGLHIREEASDVIMMTGRSDGTFIAEQPMPAKEALKAMLRKPLETADASQTNENGPRIVDPQQTTPDTPQIEKAVQEPTVAATEASQKTTVSKQDHDKAREANLYNSFKYLKADGFREWIRKNQEFQDSWGTWITRELDKKCQVVLGASLAHVLASLKQPPPSQDSSPSSPRSGRSEELLTEKIAEIEELLNTVYADIAITVKYEWMITHWEVDLDEFRHRFTLPIAEDILRDLKTSDCSLLLF